VLVIVKLLKVM